MKATDSTFDVVDELAFRAVNGDRQAADAAIRVLEPLLAKIARQVAKKAGGRRVEDDVYGDVLLGAAKALTRYDGGRGRAAVFVEKTARLYAKQRSHGYLSQIAAHKRERTVVDFDQPAFRGYTPLSQVDGDGDQIEEQIAGILSSEYADREHRYQVNRWIGYRLWKRLESLEREVTQRKLGIPPRARTLGHLGPNKRAARLATNRPESYDEIARSLGVSRESVRNIVKRAIPKLGLDEMPAPVGRNRLPIAR